MRIGITMNFQFSFFSSGLSQTVLSIAEVYRIQGYEVVFVNVDEKGRTWWDDLLSMKESWTSIHSSELEGARLDYVIEVGSLLLTPEQRKFVSKKCIWFNRKPALFHDIEASLFPFERADRNLDGISEIWLYDELSTQDDCKYMELLTRKPTYLLPYIWTPSAVELYRQETQAPVWPQVAHMADKWSIHICETNTSSASSCTIPLLTMREVKKGGRSSLNPSVKIHSADNIKGTEFFRANVLAHVFSDITDMSGQFMGRQRIIDWVYDPKSIIIAHSRFLALRPYHFDALWVGIPIVHNSKVLCRLGESVSKGYYNDNEISEAALAFEKVTESVRTVEQLIELRKIILEEFTPLSRRIQGEWKKSLDRDVITSASSKVLRVGFTCMWDSFKAEYNMFTLLLGEAGKAFGRDVVGVSIDSMPDGCEDVDVLIFGPFGDRWSRVSSKIPKIHYTGENSPCIHREDVKLNLGFRHADMNDSSYLRLPLWMLEINWFRADAERIVNPKPIPIDRCCKVYMDEVRDKFCAFVVTNPRQPARNSAFQWLSQYKNVDSAGRLFNNVGADIFAGLGGAGGELRKLEFLKKYKFCLAYENESAPGYTTEKWLHAKAAGCVPIYWGDPKFEREFDIDSCIDARNVVTPKELIDLVSAVDLDDTLYNKMRSKPALDDVRRDLVRRTLSECAKRIWKLSGTEDCDLEKIPRFLGYTCDSDSDDVVEPESTVSMDSTIFVTGCNERFLSSLQIQLNSLAEQHKAIPELRAIVYLMDDVSKDVETLFNTQYKFVETRRFPVMTVDGFPDFWEAQHFAWKLWILKEICNDSSVKGRPVLYMDSGAMMCRWPRDWLSDVRKKGISLLEDPRQKNKSWCHDIFNKKLGVTNAELEEQQIWAGSIAFIAGSVKATRLFDDSLNWAKMRDVIVGAKWAGVRDGIPYGHRHDQSILSILSSRMKVARFPLDAVYCDVSLRHTFLTKKSLYVHRSLFQMHAPVATGIDDAYVINLDRRVDRMEKFKATHPDLAERVHRVSAFEGTKLQLTPKIARLFQPHDFNWKKPVMGCALSHLSLWTQLLAEREDISTYLIMEDDAKLSPGWRKAWEKIHKHSALPADWDVVYLGGILPPNKEIFMKELIEPVNEYVARVRKNTFFGQPTPSRYMHFCAYAYVLSKKGAQKVIDVLKAKGGYWTSADHMICNLHEFMNIYFTNPLTAGCFQDDDPVYCASQFNDFSRVDKFDSDLWNNTERFTEVEVSLSMPEGELDILGALDDARRAMTAPSVNIVGEMPLQNAKAELMNSCVNKWKRPGRKFVCFDGVEGSVSDMSDLYEFSWFKQIFSDKISLEMNCVKDNELGSIENGSIIILMRPYIEEIVMRLEKLSSLGIEFYLLHMSDEYGKDPIESYNLPGCKGVIRNYYRKDVVESERVAVIPLGFHWAIPNGQPVIHTPRPPFREFVWSFVGTGWAGRKEKLAALDVIPGDKKLVFMDKWNSPSMLGREENLSILLNSWFVPCPAGNNGETYRVYEALEAGAVPIIVKEEGMEEYFTFIGRYLPFVIATSWEHAAQLIYTLRAQPEIYENHRLQLLEAWENCKLHTKQTVLKVFGL